MATVIVNGIRIEAHRGETIFDVADRCTDETSAIPRSCDRIGRCKECIVEVLEGGDALSPPTAIEEFLERFRDDKKRLFRLACQAQILRDDADVRVESFKRHLRIATEGRPVPDGFDPWIRVADGGVWCDGRRVADHDGAVLGLALDIGTTTVVGHVVDLADGRTLAREAFENPQQYGGSDVVRRISYDAQYPGQMTRSIIRQANRVLHESAIDPRAIFAVTVAGNTTMRDLFFGLDVKGIGQQPFVSSTQRDVQEGRRESTALRAAAADLGLEVHPAAQVYGLPLVSHHVGSDMAAVLATVSAEAHDGPFMVVDIGTNTEVVLGHGQRLVCASCPAGPAFEGGRVSCGMAASEGAITALRRVDGAWQFEQIGQRVSRGICGSGLVDLLAELRTSGEMDPLGRFLNGTFRLPVLEAASLYFSRADAAELAQAKAANGVGQWMLLRRMGLKIDDIATYYLAGAFAHHLDLERAQRIGLILPVPDERIVRLGNASIEGARGALVSRTCRERIEQLVNRIEHVELEREPDFFEMYAEMMRIQPIPAEGL